MKIASLILVCTLILFPQSLSAEELISVEVDSAQNNVATPSDEAGEGDATEEGEGDGVDDNLTITNEDLKSNSSTDEFSLEDFHSPYNDMSLLDPTYREHMMQDPSSMLHNPGLLMHDPLRALHDPMAQSSFVSGAFDAPAATGGILGISKAAVPANIGSKDSAPTGFFGLKKIVSAAQPVATAILSKTPATPKAIYTTSPTTTKAAAVPVTRSQQIAKLEQLYRQREASKSEQRKSSIDTSNFGKPTKSSFQIPSIQTPTQVSKTNNPPPAFVPTTPTAVPETPPTPKVAPPSFTPLKSPVAKKTTTPILSNDPQSSFLENFEEPSVLIPLNSGMGSMVETGMIENAGDLNGDSVDDFVGLAEARVVTGASDDSLQLYILYSSSRFNTLEQVLVRNELSIKKEQAFMRAVGDLNQDGKTELLIGNYNKQVYLLESVSENNRTSFKLKQTIISGAGKTRSEKPNDWVEESQTALPEKLPTRSTIFADFNDDGVMDFTHFEQVANTLLVFLSEVENKSYGNRENAIKLDLAEVYPGEYKDFLVSAVHAPETTPRLSVILIGHEEMLVHVYDVASAEGDDVKKTAFKHKDSIFFKDNFQFIASTGFERDFNGNGYDEVYALREPEKGKKETLILHVSSKGAFERVDHTGIYFTQLAKLPQDFNADGKPELAIYVPADPNISRSGGEIRVYFSQEKEEERVFKFNDPEYILPAPADSRIFYGAINFTSAKFLKRENGKYEDLVVVFKLRDQSALYGRYIEKGRDALRNFEIIPPTVEKPISTNEENPFGQAGVYQSI